MRVRCCGTISAQNVECYIPSLVSSVSLVRNICCPHIMVLGCDVWTHVRFLCSAVLRVLDDHSTDTCTVVYTYLVQLELWSKLMDGFCMRVLLACAKLGNNSLLLAGVQCPTKCCMKKSVTITILMMIHYCARIPRSNLYRTLN